MLKLDMAELHGDRALAGKSAGRGLLSRLLSTLDVCPAGEAILLDFGRVSIMTASYFQAGIAPLWDEAVQHDWYPLVVGADSDVTAEIEIVVRDRKLAVWVTPATEPGDEARVVGPLEDSLLNILTVAKHDSVSAASLFKADGGDVKQTAWSNRLAQLQGQRLLRSKKHGRQLVFTAPWRMEVT